MCNFMLINFREDLQINLARDMTLPKNLQASPSSTVTADHFRKVDQMLGGCSGPMCPPAKITGQVLRWRPSWFPSKPCTCCNRTTLCPKKKSLRREYHRRFFPRVLTMRQEVPFHFQLTFTGWGVVAPYCFLSPPSSVHCRRQSNLRCIQSPP